MSRRNPVQSGSNVIKVHNFLLPTKNEAPCAMRENEELREQLRAAAAVMFELSRQINLVLGHSYTGTNKFQRG